MILQSTVVFAVSILFVGTFFLLLTTDIFTGSPSRRLRVIDPKSIEQKIPPSKTLVIIIGSLRGGQIAWESLYKNSLDPSNADLALMIGKPRQEYADSTIVKRAKYYWEVEEYEDWADAIDLIDGPGWRSSILPLLQRNRTIDGQADSMLTGDNIFGGVKGYRGSGAIIFMFRWFLTQKLKENNLVNQYDRFVITRADHYYACPFDLQQLDSSKLWSPQGNEGYGGLTDRYLIVPAKDVLIALDILPHMLSNYDDYDSCLKDDYECNPEALIAHRFRLGGLEVSDYFPRTFFTCAAKGDTSRWMPIGKLLPEGVHMKYPGEYKKALETCNSNMQFQ